MGRPSLRRPKDTGCIKLRRAGHTKKRGSGTGLNNPKKEKKKKLK